MCRNIRTLRRAGSSPTEEELHLAALQYVRKVSGFPKPSRANQMAFDAAVREVSAATARLLQGLTVATLPATPTLSDKKSPASHEPHTRPRARKFRTP